MIGRGFKSYVEKNITDIGIETTNYSAECIEHDKLSTDEYLTLFIENIKYLDLKKYFNNIHYIYVLIL